MSDDWKRFTHCTVWGCHRRLDGGAYCSEHGNLGTQEAYNQDMSKRIKSRVDQEAERERESIFRDPREIESHLTTEQIKFYQANHTAQAMIEVVCPEHAYIVQHRELESLAYKVLERLADNRIMQQQFVTALAGFEKREELVAFLNQPVEAIMAALNPDEQKSQAFDPDPPNVNTEFQVPVQTEQPVVEQPPAVVVSSDPVAKQRERWKKEALVARKKEWLRVEAAALKVIYSITSDELEAAKWTLKKPSGDYKHRLNGPSYPDRRRLEKAQRKLRHVRKFIEKYGLVSTPIAEPEPEPSVVESAVITVTKKARVTRKQTQKLGKRLWGWLTQQI